MFVEDLLLSDGIDPHATLSKPRITLWIVKIKVGSEVKVGLVNMKLHLP